MNAIITHGLDWTRVANLPGGGVINAAAAEFDDQPGPLREEVKHSLLALRRTLVETVIKAVEAGELRPDTDAEQFAFELEGIYQVTQQSRRLLDDPDADRRALGIGGRMLQALLGIATAAGQGELYGIIQASNTRALKLMLNRGFRVIPGDDATTVIVSRQLAPGVVADVFGRDASADRYSIPDFRHDPDRTPLHRRPGPGASFRARRRQVQCFAADAVGGG